MNTTVTVALAVGALVVLVAAVALRLADRLGLPSLLLYLALGLALGESGLGVEFEDAELTQTLGVAALVVILAEGGLTTRWADVRRAIGPGLALATVGVVGERRVDRRASRSGCSDFAWGFALLLAAVISSTDAAAVFATLRRLPLPRRMAAALEAESGLNDAPVILLVRRARRARSPAARRPAWWLVGVEVVGRAAGRRGRSASRIGFAGACAAAPGRRCRWPASTRWPPWRSACSRSPRPSLAHTSGLRGGLPLRRWCSATSPLPHRAASIGFAEGMASLAQIGLFVLLGLLASPARLPDARRAGAGRRRRPAAGRPAAVGGRQPRVVPDARGPSRCSSRGPGLRGAVPIVAGHLPAHRRRARARRPSSTRCSCWSSSSPWCRAGRCRGWPGGCGSPPR